MTFLRRRRLMSGRTRADEADDTKRSAVGDSKRRPSASQTA
jgi:hypothetical protein